MDKVKQLFEILASQSVSSTDLRTHAMSFKPLDRPAGVFRDASAVVMENIYPVRVWFAAPNFAYMMFGSFVFCFSFGFAASPCHAALFKYWPRLLSLLLVLTSRALSSFPAFSASLATRHSFSLSHDAQADSLALQVARFRIMRSRTPNPFSALLCSAFSDEREQAALFAFGFNTPAACIQLWNGVTRFDKASGGVLQLCQSIPACVVQQSLFASFAGVKWRAQGNGNDDNDIFSEWQGYFRSLPANQMRGHPGHQLAFPPEIILALLIFMARLVLCRASRVYLRAITTDIASSRRVRVAEAFKVLVRTFFRMECLGDDEMAKSAVEWAHKDFEITQLVPFRSKFALLLFVVLSLLSSPSSLVFLVFFLPHFLSATRALFLSRLVRVAVCRCTVNYTCRLLLSPGCRKSWANTPKALRFIRLLKIFCAPIRLAK